MVSSSLKKSNLTHLRIFIFCISLGCGSLINIAGQAQDRFDFKRIEDNSFLIEEAYNQEPGVVQHISAFQLMRGNTWVYTFTEEWPAPGQKHQISTTIPLLNSGEFGIGDIALNYRFQAIFKPRFAFSPRVSLLFPTGNFRKNLGTGVMGYQLNLPVSYILSEKIVTHYNAGVTLIPGAKDEFSSKSDQIVYNYGFSVIFLLKRNLNFMLEVAGASITSKSENIPKISSPSLFINPGMRYAFDFKSGLQIVPGIAAPIGLGQSHGEYGLFLYLSFEHPLWSPK